MFLSVFFVQGIVNKIIAKNLKSCQKCTDRGWFLIFMHNFFIFEIFEKYFKQKLLVVN